ncbi:MAG: ribbon-helix-helix protein, CopG family, partial [Anaerolineae bacterium]|nr:ribbon-helix-helix protein, CopG family [Anaerolineae bacterium]NIN97649.1 ribbon-helix-helix protein, CopG family [Anaerolineae bacterium]NIQ80630.1 ribbon-helix-helix protein, CopG family [Anaerolineae bacterium]
VRLNLDLPPGSKARLERLRDSTEADSMSEAIRRALALYDAAVTLSGPTDRVTIQAEDGTTHLIVL